MLLSVQRQAICTTFITDRFFRGTTQTPVGHKRTLHSSTDTTHAHLASSTSDVGHCRIHGRQLYAHVLSRSSRAAQPSNRPAEFHRTERPMGQWSWWQRVPLLRIKLLQSLCTPLACWLYSELVAHSACVESPGVFYMWARAKMTHVVCTTLTALLEHIGIHFIHFAILDTEGKPAGDSRVSVEGQTRVTDCQMTYLPPVLLLLPGGEGCSGE